MTALHVLIVGCGSIGRRHARNAHASGARVSLCDPDPARIALLAESIPVEEQFAGFDDAAASTTATAAVIATPSHLHIRPAKALMEAGLHVLMEKPLSDTLDGLKPLGALVARSGQVFMMGQTYRFRREWQGIKAMLDAAPLGQIQTAEFMGGHYLPDWHVREDYRTEYTAQRRMGGGVIATSLSHIFDIVTWFFGPIVDCAGAKTNAGALSLDVEDTVTCVLKTGTGVVVTVVEDFLSRIPRRTLRVNCEFGYIEVDFHRRQIATWDVRAKRFSPLDDDTYANGPARFHLLEDGVRYVMEEDMRSFEVSGNDAYLAEMTHFLKAVASGGQGMDYPRFEDGYGVVACMTHPAIGDWS